MKSINRDAISAELTGAVSTRKLKIASNWKMFKELISGIYSDKAYAIARETFANGVDSHEAAGCPERPIVVHVPSTFEPWYSIRDFGTSMTQELMETVYCTLGESTKDDPDSDDSNRFVGKFGLGSKSPFAYTDSFQVTAFHDGKAHMYDIFKGEEGPEMALLAIEESDEEQGILVSFGVDPKDIHDFVRAIKRATEGLTVTPIFLGDIELHKRTVLAEGDGWQLLDATQSRYAEARQGTVLYPLNFQAVIDCPTELEALFRQPFRFDFAIGSLDITTSREALSYDEETSKNIIQRLKSVQADIMERVKNDVNGAETYWDFCRAYFSAMETFPESRFGKIMAQKPTFRGKTPKSEITVATNNVRVERVRVDEDGKETTYPEFKFRFGSLTYCKVEGRNWTDTITFREDRDRRSNVLNLNPNRKLIVVTEDMREKNRYPAARIRKLLDKLIADTPHPERVNTTLVWFRHEGKSDFAFKRMFAAFGRPDMKVFNLLDVEHVVPPRLYQSGPRMPFKTLSAKGDWVTPDAGTPLPTEAYWVPLRNGDVDMSQGYQFSSMFMAEIKPTLVDFGAEDLPIIGIPASSRKIIQNNPDWRPFMDLVVKDVPTMFDEEALKRYERRNTYFSVPDLVEFIQQMAEKCGNRQLVADALSPAIFSNINDLVNPPEASEDDARQTVIFKILHRLADHESGVAARENQKMIQQAISEGKDVDEVDLLPTVNKMNEVKNKIAHAIANEQLELGRLSEVVSATYPLFQFLTTSNFRWFDEARRQMGYEEVLNYMFNKRLVAATSSEQAVDIAEVA